MCNRPAEFGGDVAVAAADPLPRRQGGDWRWLILTFLLLCCAAMAALVQTRSVAGADDPGRFPAGRAGAIQGTPTLTSTSGLAALSIAMMVTPAAPLAGDVVTHSLVITNQGDVAAVDLVITDILPVGVMVDVAHLSDSAALSDTGASPPYVWRLPELGAGERVAITITGRLTDYLPTGLMITHTAIVAASTPDANPADNTSSAAHVIQCPSSYVVNTPVDAGGGSLRQALVDVCAGGAILFALALTASGPATITLTGGALMLTQSVTLTGPGPDLLTVSGNQTGRVLVVEAGAAATVTGMTLRDGVSTAGGGAIDNQGALTLRYVRLAHNASTHPTSDQGGGAIYSRGALTVSNSIFYSNTARYGGAIYCAGIGGGACRLELSAVTFANNAALNNGGALYNVGAAEVRLTNAILWGNTALAGQQIYNNNTTPVIDHSVVAGGDSGSGGDSGLSAFTDGAGNEAADPYFADMAAGDLRLLPGSSAIDAGAACPADDFTGVARPQPAGGACDIGAHEAQQFTAVATGGAGQSAIVGAHFGQPLTLIISSAADAPVIGGRIRFAGPSSGASIAPVVVTGTITSGGVVSVAVSANAVTGTYAVVASAPGVAEAVLYTLTNLSNATLTALNSVRNPSVVGEAVTFTATVTAAAPEAGTPTGVVTFTIDGVAAPAVLNNGVATYLTTTLAVGEHEVAAAYGGDAIFAASVAAPLTQTVSKASTTTTLTSAPNPATLLQAVHLTATVTVAAPGAGTPGGVVVFRAGAAPLGSSAIDANGVVTLTVSNLAVGEHVISASYEGDASFAASASPAHLQRVIRIATLTTLAATPATTVYGEALTLTATVTAAAPGAGAPTGVVTFTADGIALGAGVVGVDGVVTLTTTALTVGDHMLGATYSGDADYADSAASEVLQRVNQASTTITLSGAPTATVYGQPVVYTATVSIVAPGAGTLAGIVTFTSGGATLGVAPVDPAGVATLTTTGLEAGVHPITATYGEDPSFAASSSTILTQTVSQATTTLTVATAPNPALAQTRLVFTATIGVVAPGGGAPTGVVTFTAGSVVFTATAVAGVAIGELAILDVGVHAIRAVYAGNHNYIGDEATGDDQAILCLPTAVVRSAADAGLASLRRAINDVCDEGEIVFDVYAPVTISLTSGALALTRDVTITGPGPDWVSVSGAGLSRLFVIAHGVTARISGLTLRDGRVPVPENGGAIYNQGTLTLTNCALVNNRAGNNGGALYNHFSQLDVRGARFQANSAGYWGGAIASYDGALTVADSYFVANSAGYWGGALLVNAGEHAVGNATFSENSAGYSGGGIALLGGALASTNVTLVGNSAFIGGAVSNQSGRLLLRNAIVSDSRAGGNCAGVITDGGANLESSATCGLGVAPGSHSNVDALLAPLEDSGGGVGVYALLPGSPAIDAGDPAACASAPVDSHDQRGVVRPQGAACDIGAFESRGFALDVSGTPQRALTGDDFAQPLQVTLYSAGDEPVGPGGLIFWTPPAEGAGIDIYAPFTLTTDASGVVSITATANDVAGSYGVTVTTRGALTPTAFLLTNRLRNLRVGKIGDGVGSITSEPAGIDCGVTCATAFDIGEAVTLTAQAAVGSSFAGWEGCDVAVGMTEAAPSCRVTVQALSRVTATFQLNVYSITVTSDPTTGGQVSGGGAYRHGFPVIVAATPNPGYVFISWTEGGEVVSSSSHYAFTATAPRTLVANFALAAPPTLAVADIATALTGRQVEIPVLENDVDGVGAGLTMTALTQPAHGLATLDEPQRVVRYLSADFSGVDLFTYTVRDGAGYTDTATVAVVVQPEPGLYAETRAVIIDPAVQNTVHFMGSRVALTVTLPAGFYDGVVQAEDVLFARYTTILTPTAEVSQPPAGLRFGNLLFDLAVYVNDEALTGVAFAQPIVVTIAYDPATLGVEAASLQLLYWAGTEWRSDGVTLLSHDVPRALLTAALRHLSEFALFGAVAAPADRGLYLPLVMSGVAEETPPVDALEGAAPPNAVQPNHLDDVGDGGAPRTETSVETPTSNHSDAPAPPAEELAPPDSYHQHLPVILHD